jgi:uncharacterized protein involved in exopolysaccharide biosynthesis
MSTTREAVPTASPPGHGKPRATWALSDPWYFLILLSQHWKLLLFSALAGAIALFLALLLVSPRYDIDAKLILQFGREMMAPPGVGAKDGAQVMPAAKRPEDIASEVEILSNPRLIRQVVEHFGEDFFFAEHPPETLWQWIKRIPKVIWRESGDAVRNGMVLVGLRPQTTPLDRVVLAIGSALHIEAVRKSDVIDVKLGYPDPHVGVLLLEKYLEYAAESHLLAHKVPEVREFFAAEREARSGELRQAEERLLALRNQLMWSKDNVVRLSMLKIEAELLQQQTLAIAAATQTEAEISRGQAALDTLRLTTGANQQYETLTRDLLAKQSLLEGQRARITQTSAQLQRMREQLRANQASEIELVELEREVARLRRGLDLYEKALEDARIAEAMDRAQVSNLKVIMPPTADVFPSFPPVRLFLLLGIVGGLTLAILFIVAREMLRGMRRDQQDVAEVAETGGESLPAFLPPTRVPPPFFSARHR